jgi:hypothetical protein
MEEPLPRTLNLPDNVVLRVVDRRQLVSKVVLLGDECCCIGQPVVVSSSNRYRVRSIRGTDLFLSSHLHHPFPSTQFAPIRVKVCVTERKNSGTDQNFYNFQSIGSSAL